MYKYGQGEANIAPTRRRTRGDMKIRFRVERPKREKYRTSPLYRGMLEWNELDEDVQKSPDIIIFKKKAFGTKTANVQQPSVSEDETTASP